MKKILPKSAIVVVVSFSSLERAGLSGINPFDIFVSYDFVDLVNLLGRCSFSLL